MLGSKLKRLRKANGISQVEVARRLAVSKQSVSNWENNNIMPSVEMVRKICLLFSCSADYLLELGDNEQFLINTSELTVEQAACVRQIASNFADLNSRLQIAGDEQTDEQEEVAVPVEMN